MAVSGVDGCKAGWFFIRMDGQDIGYGIAPCLSALVEEAPKGSHVFVDIPVGLSDSDGASRGCDTSARRLLGAPPFHCWPVS